MTCELYLNEKHIKRESFVMLPFVGVKALPKKKTISLEQENINHNYITE